MRVDVPKCCRENPCLSGCLTCLLAVLPSLGPLRGERCSLGACVRDSASSAELGH